MKAIRSWTKRTLALCLTLGWALLLQAANDRFTLVIDPGHGGNDAGALGNFSKEKNINLKVALAFGRLVERNCPDVKVVYKRKTDVFVPLHERAHIANRNKADLFVSIHTNALPKGKRSRGLETYTLGMHRVDDNFDVAKRENSVILIEKDYQQHYEGFDPRSSESYIMFEFLQDKNMAQSVELARLVQNKTCTTTGRVNKGVKQAGFLVLRETSMPSCLIELGFITTPEEENYLNSENGVNNLGKGIYQAFVEYKRKYDKRITVPYRPKNDNDQTAVQGQSNETAPKEQPGKAAEPAKKDESASKDQSQRAEVKTEPEKREDSRKNDCMAVEAATEKPVADPTDKEDKPVFKVQILASYTKLKTNDAQLKGQHDADSYEENGMTKYTCGASCDYNAIYRLRKSLLAKFPQAFIIAFKNGQKMNVNEAIQEFKRNKQKQ